MAILLSRFSYCIVIISFLLFSQISLAQKNRCIRELYNKVGVVDETTLGEKGELTVGTATGRAVGKSLIQALGIPGTTHYAGHSKQESIRRLRLRKKKVGIFLNMHLSPVPSGRLGYGVKLTLNASMLNLDDGRIIGGKVSRADYFRIDQSCTKKFKKYFNLKISKKIPDCLTKFLNESDSTFYSTLPEPYRATKNPATALGRVLRTQLRTLSLCPGSARPAPIEDPPVDVFQ